MSTAECHCAAEWLKQCAYVVYWHRVSKNVSLPTCLCNARVTKLPSNRHTSLPEQTLNKSEGFITFDFQ